MWIVGEYYGIPEVQYLSDVDQIVDNITPSCGIKHSVGFAYHESEEPFRGEHGHQLIPPHLPFYSEGHFLREHIDHYLVDTAQEYGVDYVDHTLIADVEFSDSEVTVSTDRGTVTAAFYIDSTGGNSIVADKMGYTTDAPALATDSRAIFTHVEGLAPFDEFLSEVDHPNQSNRLHDGTLHHVFDGGWMWVIPFDNFERSEATNASIGLMLDREKYPVDESLSAEAEFYDIISQFPDIERHLESVTAIRPWVRTGRLQRVATQSAGTRHYLTNNTFGFVDPLYSNGLINTFESVFLGTHLLLEAFETGDFSAAQFDRLDQLHHRQISTADVSISTAYKSMGDFRLWNAWTQLWLAQILFHDLYIQRHCFKYFASGDRAEFDRLLDEVRPGDNAPFVADKERMTNAMCGTLDRALAGDITVSAAEAEMLAVLQSAEWLPKHVYDWGSADARHVDFYDEALVGELLKWGQTASPEHLRSGLFDFELPKMA